MATKRLCSMNGAKLASMSWALARTGWAPRLRRSGSCGENGSPCSSAIPSRPLKPTSRPRGSAMCERCSTPAPRRQTQTDIPCGPCRMLTIGDRTVHTLRRDRRAAAVVDFAEAVSTMCPTVCQPQRRAALAAWSGQPIVAGIAADLQDTVEALEERFGIFAAAPGRGRVYDTPTSIADGLVVQHQIL